jgi:hypothetical protein
MQFGFQLLNVPGKRGLRDTELARGRPHTAAFHHCQKIANLRQSHDDQMI